MKDGIAGRMVAASRQRAGQLLFAQPFDDPPQTGMLLGQLGDNLRQRRPAIRGNLGGIALPN